MVYYGAELVLTTREHALELLTCCQTSTCILVQVNKLHRIGVRFTKAGAAALCLSEYANEHQKVLLKASNMSRLKMHATGVHNCTAECI